MKIENCTQYDINDVYNLMCVLENTTFDYEEFKKAYNYKLNKLETLMIKAVHEDKTVGFLNMDIEYKLHHVKKIANIEELVVLDEYRSHGIGKALLEYAINHARNQECELVELVSSFPRTRAHEFYLRHGFAKTSYNFVYRF